MATATFELVVRQYERALIRMAYAMTGDIALAEDAVQSCWQSLWESRGRLRDPDALGGWLFTVTGNNVRRAMRRRRLLTLLGQRPAPGTVDGPSVGHLDLAAALDRLTLPDRQLLALRYDLGLDSPAIGRILGLSASGVRARQMRLMGRLRKELRP
jgi:RNA polymerase sigma-70 factor, ECF subfamily